MTCQQKQKMKFSSPIFFVYAKVCVTEVVWLGFPDLNECSEKKFTHLKLMLNCVDLTSNEEKKSACNFEIDVLPLIQHDFSFFIPSMRAHINELLSVFFQLLNKSRCKKPKDP